MMDGVLGPQIVAASAHPVASQSNKSWKGHHYIPDRREKSLFNVGLIMSLSSVFLNLNDQ